jgi:uridine phosphorylase
MCSYGNLYFAKDAFSGCHKAEVTTEVSEALKRDVEDRFVVGPVVDRDFWGEGTRYDGHQPRTM